MSKNDMLRQFVISNFDNANFNFSDFIFGKGQGNGVKYAATDLPPANGNLGDKLLQPINKNKIKIFVDGLISLGINTVALQCSLPLLFDDYVDEVGNTSADYLSFYKFVVEYLKSKNLFVFIEISPVFSGTKYSNVQYNYSALTKEEYLQKYYSQIVTIIEQIVPDFISFVHEPDTANTITGICVSDEEYIGLLKRVYDYNKDIPSNVKIGGGMPISESFERIVQVNDYVDFYNIHVYPYEIPFGVNNTSNSLIKLYNICQYLTKPAFIGETWVFKSILFEYFENISPVELSEKFYDRNTWNFEEIDADYIRSLCELCDTLPNLYGFCLFWPVFLFANIDGTNMQPDMAYTEANRAAFENILSGTTSVSGTALRTILRFSNQ